MPYFNRSGRSFGTHCKARTVCFRMASTSMGPLSTCYMCDSVATSREHAPPRCFFPILKQGVDLRKNLITVPSCDNHNSQKSKDDEYLRTVILMSVGNNGAAHTLVNEKLLRAVARRPNTYQLFFADQGAIPGTGLRALKIN